MEIVYFQFESALANMDNDACYRYIQLFFSYCEIFEDLDVQLILACLWSNRVNSNVSFLF